MLLEILNLEGVKPLTKFQQGKINGGQTCILTFTWASDGTSGTATLLDAGEGSLGSQDANDVCVGGIVDGTFSSCSYDCEYDGWGQ